MAANLASSAVRFLSSQRRVVSVAAGILLALLPIAWWSVQFMRWWSKVLSLSQRPEFQRART